jgi:ketosteroid isomerase-like protein
VWRFQPWQGSGRDATPRPLAGAESTATSRAAVRPIAPPPAAPVPPAAGESAPPPARATERPLRPPRQRPAPERARPSAPLGAAREPRKDSAPGAAPAVAPQGAAATPPLTSPAPTPSAAAPTLTPPPPPAAPAPIDPRPQIESAIATYAQALQSRDINAVKRIAPGLGPQALQGWRDFFQRVRDLRVSLHVRHVDASGATAQVDVSGTSEFVQDGQNVSQPMNFRATLERGADGWRITALQ